MLGGPPWGLRRAALRRAWAVGAWPAWDGTRPRLTQWESPPTQGLLPGPRRQAAEWTVPGSTLRLNIKVVIPHLPPEQGADPRPPTEAPRRDPLAENRKSAGRGEAGVVHAHEAGGGRGAVDSM